ncbi:hypothetical protein NLI96_g776 [Meripilus lineatus]|uniref:Fungal-type protein kinase domain-containing protein n=1 Tax=Meripilus lineatus TaxID=2056292 RepID=A0AAD5YLN8_9APHY|nr:hypothetical protein NLI96_g776 [Physisporinus lineatus]
MSPEPCNVEDRKFVKNHLTQLNTPIPKKKRDQQLLDKIQTRRRKTTGLIVALSQLLTEFSQRMYEKMTEGDRPAHPYVFINRFHYLLTHHPHDSEPEKDIIAVPGPKSRYLGPPVENAKRANKSQVRFDDVVSLVKCRALTENGLDNAVEHSRHLLSSRPDMVGTYVLWAHARCYQIVWTDASGTITSPRYKWAHMPPLFAYLSSLYTPPKNHVLFDPTITRTPHPDTTLWTITSRNHGSFIGCRKVFLEPAWGGRTNVWIQRTAHQVVVIKDTFLTNKRQKIEEGLLRYIHRRGIYPGVIRLLFTGDQAPSPPLTIARLADGSSTRVPERVRARLFMGSYGSPISEARSVKDMLMAFYDVLEVLRGLSMEMNVLHRDISTENIVIYPEHHPDTMKDQRLVECPPIFISQILAKDKTNDGTDKATGLLIDFDQGIQLVPDPTHIVPVDQDRTQKVGTAMFMSRSGSKGAVRWQENVPYRSAAYWPMPTLEGEVRELYELAYGSEMYDRYCDTPETEHGARPNDFIRPGPGEKLPFVHKPHHDVESLCWALIYMLFHVQPLERTEEVDLGGFWAVREFFHNHEDANNPGDSRNQFFGGWTDFRVCLDPKLTSFNGFIWEILYQIQPEYDLLDPPPPPGHLHEAIRRLLLKAICEMEDPIALDPGNLRPLTYPVEPYSDDPCDLDDDVPSGDDNGDTNSSHGGDFNVEVKTETNKLKRKMDIGPDDAEQQGTKRPRGVDSSIM